MTMQDAPTQGAKDRTKQHTLPSGAILFLGRPSFGAASRLRNAVAKALSAQPLSPEEMKTRLADLKGDASQGGALLQRVLGLVSSEEVEAALFSCLAESSYQPAGMPARVKIDRELLDHDIFGDAARGDLYPMFFRAGEAAIQPFLGPLVSMYKAFLAKAAAGPASTPHSPPSA